jgi:hypothetical protein
VAQDVKGIRVTIIDRIGGGRIHPSAINQSSRGQQSTPFSNQVAAS